MRGVAVLRGALLAACAAFAAVPACYDSTHYGSGDGGGDTDSSTDDWACADGYYGAGDGCDCGCAIVDPDCGGAGCTEPGCTADGCQYCWDGEGVAVSCVPAPDGWTCADAYYSAGDGCDCGCGIDDPDCAGAGCTEPGCTADGCAWCWDASGSLTACTPPPDGWSCAAGYYGDGYCDCGCGALDTDCGGEGCAQPGCYDGACEYCFGAGGAATACAPGADAGPDAG
jgi:hypothetical protein